MNAFEVEITTNKTHKSENAYILNAFSFMQFIALNFTLKQK